MLLLSYGSTGETREYSLRYCEPVRPRYSTVPLHVNVFQRVALTEDVGTLEMLKRAFDIPSDVAVSAPRGSAS